MAREFGTYGPSHPLLGRLGYRLSYPLFRAWLRANHVYDAESGYARERAADLRRKLQRGESVYLVGVSAGAHNAGTALVRVSAYDGVCLIANNEEERFAGIKHYNGYPEGAVRALRVQMDRLGIGAEDVDAVLGNFDYGVLLATAVRSFMEELPGSVAMLHPAAPDVGRLNPRQALGTARRLGRQLGMGGPVPIIGMGHHENHAYFSYAVSPFAGDAEPVMVTVIDGHGDDSAISLFVAEQGRLRRVYANRSLSDSLGTLYSYISSTQGGWTPQSSEGRYMGAAAWGNQSRLTNPYYRRLRQLLYFDGAGEVHVNRSLAEWPRYRYLRPYSEELEAILGPPIPYERLWNPDAVLTVEDREAMGKEQEALDKAAATQLLFEDALLHVVEHLIRSSGSQRLVLSGGTALNCPANERLLEAFDEAYYGRYLGRRNARLHVWAPPTPGDAGTVVGAAYHFALANGAKPGKGLQHAFYCGLPPRRQEIVEALEGAEEVAFRALGNVQRPERREAVADLIAGLVANDEVVGLFQGVAETGPRALGHRSIVANPCHRESREILNRSVKVREAFRPLAPMVTPRAARRWFLLSPGAADDDYNAYNYMVLTVRARLESREVIPAVIHEDGTARIQIVRRETDPFTFCFLEAMGRRVGVEVSINTSLNVGGPIVQTPRQALDTLKRAPGMAGLLLIAEEGEAYFAWGRWAERAAAGERPLSSWLNEWEPG